VLSLICRSGGLLERFMRRVSPEQEGLNKVTVEGTEPEGAKAAEAAPAAEQQQAAEIASIAEEQAAEEESMRRESATGGAGPPSMASEQKGFEEQSGILSPRRAPSRRSHDHE
jgi:hypothetical protein